MVRSTILLAALLSMALAACAPVVSDPAPTPRSTTTPSNTPSPTGMAVSPEVRVEIATDALEIYEDGALASSWEYSSFPAEEIADLTAAFGFDADSSTTSGPCESGPCNHTTYAWDSFVVTVREPLAGPVPIRVSVTSREVRGVP